MVQNFSIRLTQHMITLDMTAPGIIFLMSSGNDRSGSPATPIAKPIAEAARTWAQP